MEFKINTWSDSSLNFFIFFLLLLHIPFHSHFPIVRAILKFYFSFLLLVFHCVDCSLMLLLQIFSPLSLALRVSFLSPALFLLSVLSSPFDTYYYCCCCWSKSNDYRIFLSLSLTHCCVSSYSSHCVSLFR